MLTGTHDSTYSNDERDDNTDQNNDSDEEYSTESLYFNPTEWNVMKE